MRKTWLVTALCVGFVAFIAGCASSRSHKEHMLSGILDGKTFAGQVGMGDQPPMSDTLTFKEGYFHSSACDRFHFGSGAYLAVASDDATTFQVITSNHQGATNVWKGTVKGDVLEGTVTLQEKGKEPVKGWVKATLQ